MKHEDARAPGQAPGEEKVVAAGQDERGLLKLRVELRREPAGLVLSYAVTNHGYHPVYLCTPLEVYSPSARTYGPSPGQAYRSWKDGVLLVSKRVWPLPTFHTVNRPLVPYLTRLGPEERFSESITIPSPVSLRVPYGPTGRAAPDGVAKQVVLTLGYLDSQEVSPRPAKGHPGLYRLQLGAALKAQRLLECEPLEMTVQVEGPLPR